MKTAISFGPWTLDFGLPAMVIATLFSLPSMTMAGADSGVYGRAAWRGELVPGVVVAAYKDGKSAYLADPVAVSDPAGTDGA